MKQGEYKIKEMKYKLSYLWAILDKVTYWNFF